MIAVNYLLCGSWKVLSGAVIKIIPKVDNLVHLGVTWLS